MIVHEWIFCRQGVHVHSFAIIATSSVLLPGIEIASDFLVGALAVVNRNVEQYSVVVGNPAKPKGYVREITNKYTVRKNYPWRYYFDRNIPWEGLALLSGLRH